MPFSSHYEKVIWIMSNLNMEHTEEGLGQFMQPGVHTDGIRNLILFYNGHYESNAGVWKKETFIPYVSYVDKELKPKEWLFDGGLFLAKWSNKFHGYEESEHPTDLEDWLWYLDKSFAEDGDLSELNRAIIEVGEVLGDQDYKMKVVLMIPYPAPNQAEFGEVNGESLSFDHSVVIPDVAHANKKKALRWYIDELMKRWNEAAYSRLSLAGLYWMNETVNQSVPQEEELIQHTSSMVHALNLKFFWIPYFNASLYWKWKELGFDAAVLQPNHFFTATNASRIEETAALARKSGMGVEMEVDYRVFESDGSYRQKYINYLDGGINYGFAGNVFRGYYQDVKLLASAAASNDPVKREIYDWTCRFIQGTYEKAGTD